MKESRSRRGVKYLGCGLFWMLVWQLISMIARNNFLIAGPAETLKCLWQMLWVSQTYQALWNTAVSVSLGFAAAFMLGAVLALVASQAGLVEYLLEIPVQFAKSVPVAAFVVLVLLWFGAGRLSVVISAVIAFPVIYSNVLTGLRNKDRLLQEMAQIYEIPFWRRLWRIDVYELYPYFVSGGRTAYGMCWKAGIAAEVIAIARNTVGESLYLAKIYLATEEIFAWIILILVVSGLCEAMLEGIFLMLGKLYGIERNKG